MLMGPIAKDPPPPISLCRTSQSSSSIQASRVHVSSE